MSLLDDFLLGRGQERRSINRAMMDDFLNARVTSVGPRGVVVERPDTRASTLGAATALQRTTGRLPEGFFNRVNEQAPNTLGSSVIAFDAANAENTFGRLAESNIQPGSTVRELSRVLSEATNGPGKAEQLTSENKSLRELLDQVLRGSGQGRKRQPFGSSAASASPGDSDPGASSDGFASINQTFTGDFVPQGNRLPATNNDVSALGNFLNNLNLETQGSNPRIDVFGAWLR